jgi:hypothetical protein
VGALLGNRDPHRLILGRLEEAGPLPPFSRPLDQLGNTGPVFVLQVEAGGLLENLVLLTPFFGRPAAQGLQQLAVRVRTPQ